MLKNYFQVALRGLWKSKFFSVLNIVGLAISISACLLVLMLVNDAYDFDRFHPDSPKTYRVITHAMRKSGDSEIYATSPFAISRLVKTQSTLVKNWVPLINRFSGELVASNNNFSFRGLATTPAFFDLFGFTLSSGIKEGLNQSQVIYLTAPLARKLYPGIDPTGKSIQWSGHTDPLRIAGVLNEFPGKTHLEFEALTSIETVTGNENTGSIGFDENDWRDYYSGYHFYRLAKPEDKQAVESELNAIATAQYNKLDLESRDAGYRFELQPLDKITPGVLMSNSMGRGFPAILLKFLSFLGLIIIVSAGFNHTNISLARAVGRAKEIGIRKIAGAGRHHIFNQFIIEAMIVAVMATGIGLVLLKLIIPLFSRLSFLNYLEVNLNFKPGLYIWYLGFALFVGVLVGVIPAMLISKIDALKSMNKSSSIRLLRHLSWRKMIIVSQLTLTLVFFFMVTTGIKQINYALKSNFGADRVYTINLNLQGLDYQKVKNEISKLSQVHSVSGASILMGTYFDSKVDVRLNDTGEAMGVRNYSIDENFLKDFNINLVTGKNFENEISRRSERSVLVNESFIRFFNLGNDTEALGKAIYMDTSLVFIEGVVGDFRYKPADYPIEPLILRYQPADLGIMHVSLYPDNDPQEAVQALKDIWAGLDRFHPMQWSFYADDIKAIYDGARDIIWIVSFFAILAITISMMGLLGIVSYMITAKRKEVAIRKVVGAGWNSVYWVLSSSYIKWMGLALLIAIPLATALNMLWLRFFAYRISWSPEWFLPGILALGFAVFMVVSIQVIRAAVSNPVLSLRND